MAPAGSRPASFFGKPNVPKTGAMVGSPNCARTSAVAAPMSRVSHALPKNVEYFDLVDGVWVAHPRCALPVAVSLRQALIAVSNTRLVQQGQQTKMEQVYNYLTGTKFKQRVDAVIDKFNDMRDDLDKERKFMNRQWAKRETQILSVVESTVGMVGDLQAIAGKAMPEIPSLDLPLLEISDAAE
ncbi:DUF2130 domain-containing protein [Bradyrhizobium sp. SSUT18]|uniref:DUF2130 domain-containing protein n=1 Tax=Bradyrhizobium sp. SSUT18 TaxID=3040602 RepID=UPI003265E2D1